MVLNAFDLTGKVAIVTGCDTGLGQGMTLGLAQAGCDIVGINRKIPHDTAAQVLALGRRFHAIQADLSQENERSGRPGGGGDGPGRYSGQQRRNYPPP